MILFNIVKNLIRVSGLPVLNRGTKQSHVDCHCFTVLLPKFNLDADLHGVRLVHWNLYDILIGLVGDWGG